MFAIPLQAFYFPSLHQREGLSRAPPVTLTHHRLPLLLQTVVFSVREKKGKYGQFHFNILNKKKKLLIKKSLSEENLHLLLVATNGSLTFLGVTNLEVPHEI